MFLYLLAFLCVKMFEHLRCRCRELEFIEEEFELCAEVEIPPLARAVKHVRAEAAASQQLAGEKRALRPRGPNS